MRKGYLAPPVVIILALIVLGVAATLIINAKLFPKPKENPQPQVSTQPSPIESPSPTPDETANWKTYVNNKHGFLIKYPSTFNLEDAVDLESRKLDLYGGILSNAVVLAFPKDEDIVGNTAEERFAYLQRNGILSIQIEIFKDVKEQLKEIAERNGKAYAGLVSDENYFVENINVDGVEGYRVTFEKQSYRHIIFKDDNTEAVFVIEAFASYTQKTKENLELFDQILSTFKFIE